MTASAKREALLKLAADIQSRHDWWLFPAERTIQGFIGTGPIFIVGDQPSTSEWGVEHPNRRTFYDTLEKTGLANAHLTDLYKKRGESSALRNGLPADFPDHEKLFQREVEILQPALMVALGQLAQRLLIENFTTWSKTIPRIWHLAYVAKAGRKSEYEDNM